MGNDFARYRSGTARRGRDTDRHADQDDDAPGRTYVPEPGADALREWGWGSRAPKLSGPAVGARSPGASPAPRA